MTGTVIVIGIVAGAVLGALIDWLIQNRLPDRPSRSLTIAVVAASVVLVILLTAISLQERQETPNGTSSTFISTSSLVLCASALLGVLVVFIGIRAIKSINLRIRSEFFKGTVTELIVVRDPRKVVGHLIGLNGSGQAAEKIPIRGDHATLGRDPSISTIVIDDPRVSKYHCRISHDAGRFWIIDGGSTSGTYVNYESVGTEERHELKTGDKISIGPCEFLFIPE